MALSTDVEQLRYDKRIVERFIEQGKVTRNDHKKHLKNLADLSEECDDIEEEIFSVLSKVSRKKK